MPPQRARSPARLLAPLALGIFIVAVVVIVAGSGGGDDGSDGRAATADGQTATTGRAPTEAPKAPRNRSTYIVKPRDTLGGIAEKTGIEVETLQELNPQLDPQALVAGQRIKLRE